MIITAVEQQKKNKNRYSVFIDGEFTFSLSDESLYLSGIKQGIEINQSQLEAIMENVVLGEARDKAFKYLSYSAKSQKEMIKKLKDNGFSDDIVNETIKFLEDNAYIDDMEYSRKFIRSKTRQGYGNGWLISELRRRGVQNSIIEEALSEFSQDNDDIVLNLLYKKIKSMDIDEFNKNERQKVYNYLMRRGFDYDMAKSAINIYWEEQEESSEQA